MNRDRRPPIVLETFVGALIGDADLRDAALGDLAEEFVLAASDRSPAAARRWYASQVARAGRSRSSHSDQQPHPATGDTRVNRSRILMLAALSSIAVAHAGAQPSATVDKDMALLRGTFSMVAGAADGAPMPDMMLKGMRRVAEGHVTTVTMAGQPYIKANFSIDPAKDPKTIDYDMIGGFTAGKRQLGIYRVGGDTVTFCFGSPGQARPAAFEARAGTGVTCSVWRREKP